LKNIKKIKNNEAEKEMWIKTDIVDEIDIENLVKEGFSKETIRKSLKFLGYHRVPNN